MLTERIKQGIALEESGRLDDAVEIYKSVLSEDPSLANAWHRLSEIAAKRTDVKQAEELARKAVDLEPKNPRFRTNLGTIYAMTGRFQAAESEYRRVIEGSPGFAHGYYRLSAIVKFQKEDRIIEQIEAQINNKKHNAGDQSLLHMAAGKYYDQTGDYDLAFHHFRLGNLKRPSRFSPQDFWCKVEAQISAFDADFFARRATQGAGSEMGTGSLTPVFVVGMPRSGTSLAEQLIASHPEAYGAGELPDIASIAGTIPKYLKEGQSYPASISDLPAWAISGFASAYLDRLRQFAPTARLVINKTMSNYVHLGLIATLFPQARVIHCRRNVFDTCLSCYFQLFDGAFHDYSCDLWHLGFVYRRYERLMAHWRSVLPMKIFELRYEELLDNQEDISRSLIEYCGLDWDPRCADFHRTDRAVGTTSMQQVRQPLYKSSKGRWRHYEKHLGPLWEALGQNGSEDETGRAE